MIARRIGHKLVWLAFVCIVVIGWACWSEEPTGPVLVYEIDPDAPPAYKEMSKDQVISRIDRILYQGPFSRKGKVEDFGQGRIQIRLFKGDQEFVEELRAILAQRVEFELRILANTNDPRHTDAIKLSKERAAKENGRDVRDSKGALLGKWVAANHRLAEYLKTSNHVTRDEGPDQLEVLAIIDDANLCGLNIERARPGLDGRGSPCAYFSLNDAGAKLMEKLTAANLPNRDTGMTSQLAIILDGKVISAPTLQSKISKDGQITGVFTKEEVDLTVGVMNVAASMIPVREITPTP